VWVYKSRKATTTTIPAMARLNMMAPSHARADCGGQGAGEIEVIKRAKLGCTKTTVTRSNVPANMNNPVAK